MVRHKVSDKAIDRRIAIDGYRVDHIGLQVDNLTLTVTIRITRREWLLVDIHTMVVCRGESRHDQYYN